MGMYTRVGEHWDDDHPLILQCHHYNALLHQALTETPYIDGRDLLFRIASEEFYDFLSYLKKEENMVRPDDILEMAAAVYRNLGFGIIDFSTITDIGGEVISRSSHLALAYVKKWGLQPEPVDDIGRAFCRAVWALTYDRKLTKCDVVQKACIACGDPQCLFEITEVLDDAA